VEKLKEITDELKTLPTNLTKVESELKGLNGKIDSQGGQITSIKGNLANSEVRLGVMEIQISKIEPWFTKIYENRESDLTEISQSSAAVLQSLATLSSEVTKQSTAMQAFYRELKTSSKGSLDYSSKFSIPVAMIATMVKKDENGNYPASIAIPLGPINRNLVKKVQIVPPIKEVLVSKDIFDPSGQLVLILGTDYDPKKVEESRSFIEFAYE